MKTEDFEKAKQLHVDAAKLIVHSNVLKRIIDGKMKRIFIDSADGRPHGVFDLKDYNDDNANIKNQPEAVQILLETFPQMLLAAYQKEIKKIEKEFEKI